jgi:hypothetical protein
VSPLHRRTCALAVSSLAVLAPIGATGCANDDGSTSAAPRTTTQSALPPTPTEPKRNQPRLARARCPAAAPPGCRSASGRILYVERVDPDGDGDAHFVLASRESITGPGLTVVDVRRDLRPHPLPGPGDRISAAGPVYRGSYGQRQIEAIEIHAIR